jgi:hypothetical protein
MSFNVVVTDGFKKNAKNIADKELDELLRLAGLL